MKETNIKELLKFAITRKNTIPTYLLTLWKNKKSVLNAFLKEVMNLWYFFNDDIKKLDEKSLKLLLEVIKEIKYTDGKNWKPFYPDFPNSIRDWEKEEELIYFQMIHYMTTYGAEFFNVKDKIATFFPENLFKEVAVIDFKQLKELKLVEDENFFNKVIENILYSNVPISKIDFDFLLVVVQLIKKGEIEFTIDFWKVVLKEIKIFLLDKTDIKANKLDAIDVLRYFMFKFTGEPLVVNSKRIKEILKKTPIENWFDKKLNELLEKVEKQDLIESYRTKRKLWNIFIIKTKTKDFSKLEMPKFLLELKKDDVAWVYKQKYNTYNGKIEEMKKNKDLSILKEYEKKPWILARNLVDLINKLWNIDNVLVSFKGVIDKIPTRLLLSILNTLKVRKENLKYTTFYPVTNSGNNFSIIRKENYTISEEMYKKVSQIITKELEERFSKLENWKNKKIFIDSSLEGILVPLSARNAGEWSLFEKWSYLNVKGDNIRAGIWWENLDYTRVDLDLSVIWTSNELDKIDKVSWQNLGNNFWYWSEERNWKNTVYHSWDITDAPKSRWWAAEFIDVLKNDKNKYFLFQTYWFNIDDAEKNDSVNMVFWVQDIDNDVINNVKVKKNEVVKSFNPSMLKLSFKTWISKQRISNVLYDKENKRVYFLNTQTNSKSVCIENVWNVEWATIDIYNVVNVLSKKMNMKELLEIHTKGRNWIIVDKKEEADIVFDLEKYDINDIQKNYII